MKLSRRIHVRPDPTCMSCDGYRTAKTVCVRARGNTVSLDGNVDGPLDILFVGEAPGRDEDATGTCFVGASGQSFNCTRAKFLSTSTKYLLTNSIRCHLGFGGDGPNKPNKGHLAACRPYLKEEIIQLRPRFIVPMGQYAIGSVLGVNSRNVTVKRYVARQWISEEFPNSKIFPMYHPAYILRSGGDKSEVGRIYNKHWELFMDLFEGRERPKPGEWRWLTNEKDIRSFYRELFMRCRSPHFYCAYDYETTGLDPYTDSFRMVGYSVDGKSAVVHPLYEPWQLDLHRTFLQRCAQPVVHAAFFEMVWSLVKLGVLPTGFVEDTKCYSFLEGENKSHRLEDLTDLFLPVEFAHYKDVAKQIEQEDICWAERCAYDCIATYQLRDVLRSRLTDKQKTLYSSIVQSMLKTVVRCRTRGWKVDRDKLSAALSEAKGKEVSLYREARDHPKVRLYEGILGKKIKLNSTKDVPKILMGMGIDDKRHRQPKNKDLIRTDKKFLERYEDKYPLVKKILEWRHVSKRISSFYKPLLKRSERDGFIRPEYNWGGRSDESSTAGTETGRFTESICMTIPREEEGGRIIRQAITSRWEDGLLVSADESQLELRLIAAFSGEPSWIKVYRDDGDLHQVTADQMRFTGPDARYRGKTLNFSLTYDIGAGLLSKALNILYQEAKDLKQEFLESIPLVKEYFNEVKRMGVVRGYVENVFGLRRRIDIQAILERFGARSHEFDHAMKQFGNFPIQSTGSLIVKRAFFRADQELMKRGMKSMVIAEEHDKIIIDTYPGELEEVLDIAQQVMVVEPNKLYDWLKVPLKVDPQIGHSLAKERKSGMVLLT